MEVDTIPKWKKVAVVAASLLFIVLSAWQVHARREDWPLSKYDMYSVKHGAFADRKVLYGVSPAGEFPLSDAGYRVSSKFWFQFSSIAKQRSKVRDLLAKVEKDYTALRSENPSVPELLALKVYRERWKIAPRMAGLDRMERKVLFDSSQGNISKPKQLPARAKSGNAADSENETHPHSPTSSGDVERLAPAASQTEGTEP